MSDQEEYLRQLEIQRKNFEAQFGSIEELGYEDKTKVSDTESLSSDDDEDDEEDDFDSDDGNDLVMGGNDSDDGDSEDYEEEEFIGFDDKPKSTEPQPTVIKFKDTTRSYEPPNKEQRKLLKSGKAPSLLKEQQKREQQEQEQMGKPKTKEDSENLQNDLELQRFLEESHILSNFQSQHSGADLTLQTIDHENPIGNARKHTLKNRLKNLSSTNGVSKTKLDKMPMSMRKGMIQNQLKKISKFEQDAKDGGIVLSKVKKGEFRNIGGSISINDRIGSSMKTKNSKHRQRGLKVHSVGKSTKNGLVISQATIDRINGTGAKGRGKKGRR